MLPTHFKTYRWSGYKHTGLLQQGLIKAPNLSSAKIALIEQGVVLQSLHRQWLSSFKKIKPKQSTYFTQQLSTLLDANIPLTTAFNLMAKTHRSNTKKWIQLLRQEVENGQSLSFALRKHQVLNELFCDLIDIGEKTGALNKIFKKICLYQEDTLRFKKKLVKIFTYPLFILAATLFFVIGLLFIVIPQFETLYKELGTPLPVYTQMILQIAHLLEKHALLILYILLALISLIKCLCVRNPALSLWIEKYRLKLPFIGSLLKKIIIARFAHILYLTYQTGLPIMESLEAGSLACNNVIFAHGICKIKEEVSQGMPLSLSMQKTQLFSEMVIQFITIGEESGRLDDMFYKITQEYEADISHILETLGNLLEPIIMALLGLLIGCLIITLYLPIINLSGVV